MPYTYVSKNDRSINYDDASVLDFEPPEDGSWTGYVGEQWRYYKFIKIYKKFNRLFRFSQSSLVFTLFIFF